MLLAHAHQDPAPSAWVQRFAGLIKLGGTVLDVACGSGRHLRWLAAQGFAVTGVDRDAAAVEPLREQAEIIVADIEAGPWPLDNRHFDAVVVTNYLWRPLLPKLAGMLNDGGVLVYETFADGQQHIGKPSRADFLLRPGELLVAFAGLRVVAFEDGFEAQPPRFVQRLVAVKAPASAQPDSAEGPRYGLTGPAS
ncbi:MAG: class I SAM-dependent methyltransferase [Rubrivivax sp.]|nr:class I SAM-dependent methyltransferase [Rubrivivax sp.]MDP3614048.1 class I SAM-dependent methyltransferase [Rubrivivax sp.]